MRKILAIAALLTTAACTDPYGRYDPVATSLAVGAGAVAVGALGFAAGQNSVPRNNYYYVAPAPRYYYGSPYRRW